MAAFGSAPPSPPEPACSDDHQVDENSRLRQLVERFPEADAHELRRFCRARPNSVEEAISMFSDHLQWRLREGDPRRLAEAFHGMPQNYCRPAGRARDGSPVLLVQAGRYDPELGPEQHVLGLCHVLDKCMTPCDSSMWTVLVDARPGENWPNMPAHRMLSFIKLVAQVLPDNYPERVKKVVVYPVPVLAQGLWWVCRSFLDERSCSKFEVISGSATLGAPCPQELGRHVSFAQLPEDAQGMHWALLEAEAAECSAGSADAQSPAGSDADEAAAGMPLAATLPVQVMVAGGA
mmetsp:Transcript_34889/g.79110  ORF Transcript_34889/g.79110 Transcript_34889/m.79110 type:complete len:292 (+) Transcript_34889:1-876(+)